MLSCNQFARRADYPDDYPLASGPGKEAMSPETVLSRGGSCIVSPLGQILAGPDHERECILSAELDRDDIVRGKLDFDPVGHYARPDVFRLHVDERPRASMVVERAADPRPGEP